MPLPPWREDHKTLINIGKYDHYDIDNHIDNTTPTYGDIVVDDITAEDITAESVTVEATGGSTPNLIVQGEDEQSLRLYNQNTSGTKRTSIKFADRDDSDWSWILFTDYPADGTNDLTLMNRGIVVLRISNEGIVTFGNSPDLPTGKTYNINGVAHVHSSYVEGPVASSDNDIVLFDGITGKLVKGSGNAVEKLIITGNSAAIGLDLKSDTSDVVWTSGVGTWAVQVGTWQRSYSYYLRIRPDGALTADKTLEINVSDGDRKITLSGNPTLGNWFDQAVKTTSSPQFAQVSITNATYGTLWLAGGTVTYPLGIRSNETLSGVEKVLNIVVGNADRTITFSGNPTLADWFDQAVKQASSPTFNNTVITTDIYTTVWTDYSSISTVVGWAATPTVKIFYKKVGKLMFVQFDIGGTSNATNVTFTLPFNLATGVALQAAILGMDNSANLLHPCVAVLNTGSATVTCYVDNNATAWTNSGAKAVVGQFFYEAA